MRSPRRGAWATRPKQQARGPNKPAARLLVVNTKYGTARRHRSLSRFGRSRNARATLVATVARRSAKTKARWARLLSLLVALCAVLPTMIVPMDCLVSVLEVDPCEDDSDETGGCPCPVTCASCPSARGVPPSRAELERPPVVVELPAPAPTPLRWRIHQSPDPSEISHVPKV